MEYRDLTESEVIDIVRWQEETCRRFKVGFTPAPGISRLGIGMDFREGAYPVNGMRSDADGDSSGGFIRSGTELSQDDDHFEALHVAHVQEICPEAMSYLALPPGWRFLI